MDIIRYGNDINVSWSVYGRNGAKYSLTNKIQHLWLVSGPRKKEISGYTLQARNQIVFLVDDTEINKLGTFKFVLEIKEPESEVEEATYELSHVFQVVSETYPMKANKVINGQTNIEIKSILNNVYISTLEGASAYEVAVENGFEGTVEEWLGGYIASVRCEYPNLIFTKADNSTLTVSIAHTHPAYESAIGALQDIINNLSLTSNGSYYTLSLGGLTIPFYSKAQVDALIGSGGGSGQTLAEDTDSAFLNFSANELTLTAEGTADKSVSIRANIPWEISAEPLPDEEQDAQNPTDSTAQNVSFKQLTLKVGDSIQIEEIL